MRPKLAMLACLVLAAGCAAPASEPGGSTFTGSASTSGPAATVLGQLYLHNDGQRTWMDATPDSADVDTTFVSVPGAPASVSFPLEPTPAAPVVTGGLAVVTIASASPVALQPPDLRVRLLVGGEVVATSYEEGMQQEHRLIIPSDIAAGISIAVDVCLCNSTADSYVMDTSGSSVTVAGVEQDTGSGTGNMTRGEVVVRRQGSQWVAERIDSASVPAAEGMATIVMSTVNGEVEQKAGSPVGFRARLVGRGDDEAEARQRLSQLYVTLAIGTEGGLSLEAHGRTRDTGDKAWNNQEIGLYLTLPATVAMRSAELQTVNGPVTSQGFRVDDLTTTATNGPVTANGLFASWAAQSTNGAISGNAAAPTASGAFHLQVTNGPIDLTLKQGSDTGVDVSAQTTNGEVSLDFANTQPQGTQSETSAHVRTQGYDSKAVRTEVTMRATNGPVTASD